jgi:Co/Zn/Cd efflux system component
MRERALSALCTRAEPPVSVLVIVGLSLARVFGWLCMDPLAGIIGAFVIASWSYGMIVLPKRSSR